MNTTHTHLIHMYHLISVMVRVPVSSVKGQGFDPLVRSS